MTSIDAIINRQLLKWELERRRASEELHPPIAEPQHIITVSRQTGSRGSYLATQLAERLGFQRLHRDVLDVMARESGYYRRLLEYLDEHTRGRLHLAVEAALSGQLIDHTDYNEYLAKVVLSMAELGGVILMGRGGNFILGPNNGFHLRVVCPNRYALRISVDSRRCLPARRSISSNDPTTSGASSSRKSIIGY